MKPSGFIFAVKKLTLLLLSGGVLCLALSAYATPLQVVPHVFTAQKNVQARFMIIAPGNETLSEKNFSVQGLPDSFTYSISCTGKRGDKCTAPAGENDLPVFFISVAVPASATAGRYPFTVNNRDNPDSEATQLVLDISGDIQFTHPGVMLSQGMLDQMKAHLQANNPQWDRAYQQVTASKFAAVDYQPSPHASVDAGGKQAEDLRNDAIAAYTQALLWTITGKDVYADNAINIMNRWSETLSSDFTGSNRFNLAAWVGDLWPRAAEIIRYTYKDNQGNARWAQADIDKFKQMLKVRHVDFINNGFFTSGQYGGNLIASQAAAFIHIGVFNDDTATFLSGIEKWRRMLPAYIYLKSDGDIPAPPVFWRNNYISRDSLLGSAGYWYGQDLNAAAIGEGGISQETCRDIGHVLWGFSALANGSETARIQGIDLSTESTMGTVNSARLSQAMEFNIALLDGNTPVPADLCKGAIVEGSSTGKGEILFNDIVTRRGLSLPRTAQYLNTVRPTGASYFMVWETLSHYLNP